MTEQQIKDRLERALTVEDLITELHELPQNARVVFTCDYGDHCHTRQALLVERIELLDESAMIYESAYSQSKLAVRDLDEDDDRRETERGEYQVVVLS